jgi:hypothetical protein
MSSTGAYGCTDRIASHETHMHTSEAHVRTHTRRECDHRAQHAAMHAHARTQTRTLTQSSIYVRITRIGTTPSRDRHHATDVHRTHNAACVHRRVHRRARACRCFMNSCTHTCTSTCTRTHAHVSREPEARAHDAPPHRRNGAHVAVCTPTVRTLHCAHRTRCVCGPHIHAVFPRCPPGLA